MKSKKLITRDPHKDFRNRLAALAGDDREGLATRLRISKEHLISYLNGSTKPDYELHRRLFGAGLDLQWLRTGEQSAELLAPVTDEDWWSQLGDAEYLAWEERNLDDLSTLKEQHLLFFKLTFKLPPSVDRKVYLLIRRKLDEDGRVDYLSLPTVIASSTKKADLVSRLSNEKEEAIYQPGEFTTLFGLNGKKALKWFELRNGEAIGRNCPFCRSVFVQEDNLVGCFKCLTVHHASCWNEAGHCCCFGCKSSRSISAP